MNDVTRYISAMLLGGLIVLMALNGFVLYKNWSIQARVAGNTATLQQVVNFINQASQTTQDNQ